jgi:3-oxoacyl-ACP reductase-like protein
MNNKNFAVVCTCSFDNAEARLFDDEESAKAFLLKTFTDEQARIDAEEDDFITWSYVTADGWYAKIISDNDCVTEYRIATVSYH